MSRILIVVYSLLLAIALGLTAPWWAWRMLRTGKYRAGLPERFGRIPARLKKPEQGAVWVHAVSVGEVLAASRLVEELAAASGRAVFVSTTTRTGQTLARERFGAERVFYFPLDLAFAVRSWLGWLQPSLVVLVESELWPRMLIECKRSGVPVAVVNARVSDRSWPRYRMLRRLWRPLLADLALVLTQSPADAERLFALGAEGARAAGNLKYDIRATAPAAATTELRARLPEAASVVVCGSTLAGEEALVLDALPSPGELITVLAPRHPERFDEVARLLVERGVAFSRRSSWAVEPLVKMGRELIAPPVLLPGMVVLLDSVGELASVYSLATVAVLGGGFLWPGGHNPLEPAQFGVTVLMGSQYDNFRDVVKTLLNDDAVILADPSSLGDRLRALLEDPERRRSMGERGRRVFEAQAGATGRAVAALLPVIFGAHPSSEAGRDAAPDAQAIP